MSSFKEKFYITASSPEGDKLLEENEFLHDALTEFRDSPEAHRALMPGLRVLGAGKYSFTFALREMLAIKVSEPTSGQYAYDKKQPAMPEDLGEQFAVLSALGKHSRLHRNDIFVPRQYFVAHMPGNKFILGQELMNGWISLGRRTRAVYANRFDDPEVKEEVGGWVAQIRARLEDGLSNFTMQDKINDVGLDRAIGVHGGNLLVPEGSALNGSIPITIIDQPKVFRNDID
jgi:hypothetical protein